MKYLIDKEKFLDELVTLIGTAEKEVQLSDITAVFYKHTKDMVDEPQHPSGMDRENINVRNKLRKELREE